jgi:menaquinone-specific isochorismate synthase
MNRKECTVESVDLLAWLNAMPLYPKLYWASRENDFEIAAVGSAPPHSACRQFGWRSFMPTQAPEWRDFASSRFFLPRFELIRRGSKCLFAENWNTVPSDHLAGRQSPISNSSYRIEKTGSLPDRPDWILGVERALEAIEEKHFEKVVLARRFEIDCSQTVDPLALLQSIHSPGQTLFFFQPMPASAFLGASPEMLYQRHQRRIVCDALAGTRPLHAQGELLESEKEMNEFLIVKDRIIDAISPLCKSPPAASPHTIRSARQAAHLYSQISAELSDNVTDEDLLNALHPTPAVAGYPKNEALSFISSAEPFARGLYAAPIGWMSPEAAAFAVGIRSCLIQGSRAYLYAGTGIVKGSDPASEWEESELKLSIFRSIFQVA